ncbi:MAG TPA: hypothetical protein VFW44_17375 [Bryobacteraceae bacterium]|nr:hypothetical protein [Bryobacteraceae bacterium]
MEAVSIRASAVLLIAAVAAAAGIATLDDRMAPALDHPTIEYNNYLKHPQHDPVAELRRQMDVGAVHLKYDRDQGYLPSVLEALHVPIESQMAVFSKTSFQIHRISPSNPRRIYFNDSVAVAWVPGGFMELAALDPEQGVNFYSLEQQPGPRPDFVHRDDCLSCHRSDVTLGVPGMILRSFHTLADGRPKLILGGFETDHRSPFDERWGGWYVSGSMGRARHMGNAVLSDPDNEQSITAAPNPGVSSDVVALLVFDHQMRMTNLITRMGWESRRALYDKLPASEFQALLRESAAELVDYLLFIDEAPLPAPVQGASGFAAKFEAAGPRDSSGRSLRQFDLHTRLFRYPCSYMIYSAAFDHLPADAKGAIYQRMGEILTGREQGSRYARLSAADRRAILEILKETIPRLSLVQR